jgi:hypothetical protein
MSQSHRVFWRGNWILAEEHPLAINVQEYLPTLICLNTTLHEVPIKTIIDTTLYVGDWEEVSTEEGRQEWIKHVSYILKAERPPTLFPTAVPLLGPGVQVLMRGDRLPIPISEVVLGDYIHDGKGLWTRVVGVYKGTIEMQFEPNSPDWMSDGVWMKNIRDEWALRSSGEKEHDDESFYRGVGYHLVTEAEVFEVLHHKIYFVVRDFTELGASRLEGSYKMLDNCINKK